MKEKKSIEGFVVVFEIEIGIGIEVVVEVETEVVCGPNVEIEEHYNRN